MNTEETKQMTAEEILDKWDVEYVSEDLRSYYSKNVIGAMEQFATQEVLRALKGKDKEIESKYEIEIAYKEKVLALKSELQSVREMAETAFNEARLTHPMLGFKHKDFQEFLTQYNNSIK